MPTQDILSRLPSKDLAQMQAQIEELGRLQENLAQIREKLLVERTKLRYTGEAVRQQRIKMGNMEGQLMSFLRRYIHESPTALPSSIMDAYEKVEEARDEMGIIEDDFIQNERAVGVAEQSFTQKENMFYQHQFPNIFNKLTTDPYQQYTASDEPLPPPPPPPPPPDPVNLAGDLVLVHDAPPPPPMFAPYIGVPGSPRDSQTFPIQPREAFETARDVEVEYNMAMTELESLRKEFDSFRPRQSELLERNNASVQRDFKLPNYHAIHSDFEEEYSKVLSKLLDCEVKAQRLRVKTAKFRGFPEVPKRRQSDLVRTAGVTALPAPLMIRAQTVVSPDEYNSTEMRLRVREWILEYSRNNPIERKIYTNILEKLGVVVFDGDAMKERTEEYWSFGATNSSSFSAGGGSMETIDDSIDHPIASKSATSGASQETELKTKRILGKQIYTPEQQCCGLNKQLVLTHDYQSHPNSTAEGSSIENSDLPDETFPSVARRDLQACSIEPPTNIERKLPQTFSHQRCRSASSVTSRSKAVSDPADLKLFSQHNIESVPSKHHHRFNMYSMSMGNGTTGFGTTFGNNSSSGHISRTWNESP